MLLAALTAGAGEWNGQGRELKIGQKSYVALTGETVFFQIPGAELTRPAHHDALKAWAPWSPTAGPKR